jgi:Transposase Tn5 dimerisation domain/Transposase DNA-binding
MTVIARCLLAPPTSFMPDRIEDEFLDVALGDCRRNARVGQVAGRLFESPAASISAACGGWTEAMGAYRLLNNSETTPSLLIAPHQEMLVRRAATESCVLVIQDTTELDFTHMKTMTGRGPLNDVSRQGFFMHSLYAVSEAGLPLGVLETSIVAREQETFGKSAARRHRPIEAKESFRWVEGYLRTQEVARQLPDCEVISISDREGDIYEVFEAWERAGQEGGPRAHWIIRGMKDRVLEGLDVEAPQKLFAALASAPELGTAEFSVTAKRSTKKVHGSTVQTQRSARVVRQRLRALRITPRRPYRRDSKLLPVSFWAVLAEEIDPPAGEDPLCWLLLTSLEVTTLEAARRIIALYLRRWDIEVFHRVLKTGCRVEQIQLKEKQAVLNCLTLYAIIAWRLLYLTHLGRQCPLLPCSLVFTDAEWRATCTVAAAKQIGGYKKGEPLQEPPLGEFIALVARLGGHLGRRGDHPPGAQALWQGLARVRDFACTWEAIYQD